MQRGKSGSFATAVQSHFVTKTGRLAPGEHSPAIYVSDYVRRYRIYYADLRTPFRASQLQFITTSTFAPRLPC